MTAELELAAGPASAAPVPHGVRLAGPLRAIAIEFVAGLYLQGASIRVIAEELRRPYTTVHRLLLDAEVPMRPRGGRRPAIRRRST